MMLRLLDIVLAAIGLIVTAPVMLIILVLGYFDTGSPLFTQVRVGRHQRPFTLIKFRTMRQGTESVATHLVNPAVVTPLGAMMRRTKLDELPQLWKPEVPKYVALPEQEEPQCEEAKEPEEGARQARGA